MPVLVIGSGVVGLSCGIRLREAGFDAHIWARDLPPHTTSNVAAAIWYPYLAYPQELTLGWSITTYAELGRLAINPASGVQVIEGIELFPAPVDDPWWRDAVPSFRRAGPAELPPGYADGYLFATPMIEMPIYLDYLLTRFRELGGIIERRALTSLEEACAVAETVVNCAGLGSRSLVGDPRVVPIRGQVVRVAQVGIERFIFDDYGPGGVTYIIPRSHDIILGGTADEGLENLEPDPQIAQAILDRCIALEPRLRHATILEHKVGLRPGRSSVRMEAEQRADRLVVHNYGHGGAGVTLSWGCADTVVQMVSAAR